MIGTFPAFAAAPLEYRFALHAAMSAVAGRRTPMVICNIPHLVNEVRQRLPCYDETHEPRAGLWVEPLADSYSLDLAAFAHRLPPGAPLVVIASLPLARYLPECRGWIGRPLGQRLGGSGRLRRALVRSGFAISHRYGVHSVLAITLNLLSRLMERWHRPALADRLHFAARLRYCSAEPLSSLATVTLVFATRELAR